MIECNLTKSITVSLKLSRGAGLGIVQGVWGWRRMPCAEEEGKYQDPTPTHPPCGQNDGQKIVPSRNFVENKWSVAVCNQLIDLFWAAHKLFKEVVGKNQDFMLMRFLKASNLIGCGGEP